VASDDSLRDFFATAALAASPSALRRAELTPLRTEPFAAESSAEPIRCGDDRSKLSASRARPHWRKSGNPCISDIEIFSHLSDELHLDCLFSMAHRAQMFVPLCAKLTVTKGNSERTLKRADKKFTFASTSLPLPSE